MVVFKIAGWILFATCVAAALAFVVAIPVMALWNWVMPAITKGAVGELTYLQAVGFYIMCHLLFKSHHEELTRDEKGRREPRPLARKIRALLAGGPEGGPAEAGGAETDSIE